VRRPTVIALLTVFVATLVTPVASTAEQAVQPGRLRLLSSDAEGVSLELLTPTYEVSDVLVEGQSFHAVRVPGYGTTLEIGRPQLPVRALLLGVPAEAHLSLDVTVLEEGRPARGLQVRPAFSPLPLLATGAADSSVPSRGLEEGAPVEDEAVGPGLELYPDQIAQVTDDAIMRGQRIVRLELHPLQLDTRRDELLHHRRVRVKLHFSYEEGQQPTAKNTVTSPAFESVFQGLLLNYDSARGWRRSPERSAASLG